MSTTIEAVPCSLEFLVRSPDLPLSILRLPLTVMTNEPAVQLLKGHQDLPCDKRRVSPETCVMVIGPPSGDSNESIGLLQKG